jgi:hypothetical protein
LRASNVVEHILKSEEGEAMGRDVDGKGSGDGVRSCIDRRQLWTADTRIVVDIAKIEPCVVGRRAHVIK